MYKLAYKDNTKGNVSFLDEAAVDVIDRRLVRNAVAEIANRTFLDLQRQDKNVLVIPRDFGSIKDDLKNSTLIKLGFDDKIETGNVVGWFGVKSAHLSISIQSRFDSGDQQYFLCYLLERVLGAHVVNLPTVSSPLPVLDFAALLFPSALKCAYAKGMFKTYCCHSYNGPTARGVIDIPKLIKNLPFVGKLPCKVRERSGDNALIQLVRHTIEYLASSGRAAVLGTDRDVVKAVSDIRSSTPSYSKGGRSAVIAQNLKPKKHPYYFEYTYLQKVCLQILRHEKISFSGNGDADTLGVVFDVSWLWEEYLNKVMCSLPGELVHPRNKERSDAIHLYADGSGSIYPDYMWRSTPTANEIFDVILDAKYKRMQDANGRAEILASDVHAMNSYVAITGARKCMFIFPSNISNQASVPVFRQYLARAGGVTGPGVYVMPFVLPAYTSATSYDEFKSMMRLAESNFSSGLCAALSVV